MKRMFLIAAGAVALAAPATAAPVLWIGNGHYYEYVQANADWATARAAALASSYLGRQGYLVTLTSAAENSFVSGLSGNNLAWTGGNDINSEGTWVWADGPEAGTVFWVGGPGGSSPTYANWGGGEPNDFLGDEDAMHLGWYGGGQWNDYFATSGHGFIVEYGGLVPEPATWALFILGFGAVGGALRRSRKVRAALTYA